MCLSDHLGLDLRQEAMVGLWPLAGSLSKGGDFLGKKAAETEKGIFGWN